MERPFTKRSGAASSRRVCARALTLSLLCGSAGSASASEANASGANTSAGSASTASGSATSPSSASPSSASPSAASSGAAGTASGSAASADCVERAEAYAAEAFQAYADRDYDGAVALYLKAYEAAPSADILFNLARVHDLGLQDLELAISFYQDYLVAPDAEPGRVEVARERISRLEALQHAAREPHAYGGDARTRLPMTGAGLTGRAPASTPSDSGTASPSPWTPWRVGAALAGGLGIIGIGTGAGFGLAALSAASTARQDCDGNVCASRVGIDASHSAGRNADIATAGFVIGGGLLAAGLALLWFDLDGASGHDTLASTRLGPIATTSQWGVGLAGSW